jgi:OPA family glycerol-3-phosphate transporter-like MFS transporter 3
MIFNFKGLFISGILGDRFNLRIVLTLGMCTSAITVFMFGTLSEWLQIYNKFWYIFFWILNGLAQSTGWPAVVAVMVIRMYNFWHWIKL